MQSYKADLHTHTVLSPCGSLEMSPLRIIEKAKQEGIKLLGITDHNSTLMCKTMHEVGMENNLNILPGAEITTREEVHCLAFFDDWKALDNFQQYLDHHLPNIKHDPNKYGYQVIVDRDEQITGEIKKWLITAINQTIEQVEQKVHELNGIFIPAHIDRPVNSLVSQLGFIPPDIKADALELSKFTTKKQMEQIHPIINNFSMIQSSDAHFIENIGDATCKFELETLSFNEIRMAFKKEGNRKIILA